MKKIGLILRENIEQLIDTKIKDSKNAFVMSYSKISASDFNGFRLELRKFGARLFVSKNTSAKRALKGRKLDKMIDFVDGPTAFILGVDEPILVSKILIKFAKDHEGIRLRGGILEQEIIDGSRLKSLASLPSKEVLQVMALRAIQSPLSGIVNTLSCSLRQVVYVIKQLSERRGG